MKLVHVASSDRFWGFLAGQLRHMKTRGLEVHVVSSPGPLLAPFAAEEGVRAWAISIQRGITPWRDLQSLWRLWRLLRRLRPSILHAHTPKAGLLALLAARGAGRPVCLYTLHGLVWQTRGGWRRRLLLRFERLTCRLADRVLSVSPSVRDAAVEAGLASPEKIGIAGPGSINGIDFDRFNPAACAGTEDLRLRYGIPPGAPVIGFSGRLVPDKGIATLIAAWSLLREEFPDLRLLVAGETEGHDPLPEGLLARLRCDPRVIWAGWTPRMPEHYLLMNVCLLPSRREGLPYAALEAAAMERPLAGSRVTGTVDAVADGETGLLVPPDDAAGLAAAARRLLRDPELAARLGRQARRRVEAHYRQDPLWAAIYQHYCDAGSVRGSLVPRPLWWKRPLDLVLALLLLALLSPLMALIALAVLAALGPPVIYRQMRPGRGERPFELLKFRTMQEARDEAGPPLPDGVRLTRLGRYLRRTSLDELPQIFNILRGEMSFVGPRPMLQRYLACYTPEERRRHTVRPGLTGWAQVHGRNRLPWTERLALDVWYVDRVSLLLDLRIAAMTVWKMLTGEGAEEDPSASMLDLDAERRGA